MEMNTRAKDIMDLCRKYSNEYGISTMGSEFLILAMYETKDSLCHFLLSEYEVTREEIFDKTDEVFILRKKEGEYDKSIETILSQASILAGDKLVSEEHLFMAILMNRNTVASSILVSLGLNIDDLIEDVKEVYDFSSGSTDEIGYIKNITKMVRDKECSTYVERKDYLTRIDIIMNRRFKNNPLLIGNAGVGKTALVEGYAMKLQQDNKDMTILSLNLTSMLAGTRYRGDFEERFDKFVKEIAQKKNVIIFIDEIHIIMGAATTEGNLDVANMLKPFLARNDIKVIGATTLEEYHKSIENDKALGRRFQPVFISEPDLEETKKILFGIRNDYEKYHNVTISDEALDYLIYESDKKILKKYRPDKCIDVLDDVMSFNHINNKSEVTISDINKAIEGFCSNSNDVVLNFSTLKEFEWLNKVNLLEGKPLLKLLYKGCDYGLCLLKDDLKNVFHVGDEAILELDLSGYKDNVMLTSLIGAPPGYVGYEDEGVLSKHILLYPTSVIILKNFSSACQSIKAFFLNLKNTGMFVDQKGRRIILDHSIMVFEGVEEKRMVGFSGEYEKATSFDEVITYQNNNITYNEKYSRALKRMSYEVSFDFDVSNDEIRALNHYLYDKLHDKNNVEILVKKEELKKC